VKEHLLALLTGRLELDEEEAARALAALQASPELCRWLRAQYRMDAALSLALRADPVDFPNRIRAAAANPATEDFLARLQQARAQRLQLQARMRRRQGVFAAVAALLIVGLCGALAWVSLHPDASSNQVLVGQVQVNRQDVHQIPLDQDFTVTGSHTAVISFGHDSQVELTPSSQASLHANTDGSRNCELDAGSGTFSLHGASRINAGTASVSGENAQLPTQVIAQWSATPRQAPQLAANPALRSLEISVNSGKAQIVCEHQSQVLHPHETLILEMTAKHTVATSHRGFKGTVWAVANQVADLALAVGDARSQRTCIIPKDLVVEIDGQKADPLDIRRGDAIDVQFAPNRTDLVSAARITTSHGLTDRPGEGGAR